MRKWKKKLKIKENKGEGRKRQKGEWNESGGKKEYVNNDDSDNEKMTERKKSFPVIRMWIISKINRKKNLNSL